MIPEIGVMIGVYILARLIPADCRRLAATGRAMAALVTLAVVADLALQGLGSGGLAVALHKAVAHRTPTPATVQEAATSTTVTRADGGSIATPLGYGIVVAGDSTLRREWIAIHDSSLPVELEGTPGITTAYIGKEYGGEYRYRTKFKVKSSEPLAAIDVRFLIFDVWGRHIQTLDFGKVADIERDDVKEFTPEWSVYSENEVERHYASIAYIARIRLRTVALSRPMSSQ